MVFGGYFYDILIYIYPVDLWFYQSKSIWPEDKVYLVLPPTVFENLILHLRKIK